MGHAIINGQESENPPKTATDKVPKSFRPGEQPVLDQCRAAGKQAVDEDANVSIRPMVPCITMSVLMTATLSGTLPTMVRTNSHQ